MWSTKRFFWKSCFALTCRVRSQNLVAFALYPRKIAENISCSASNQWNNQISGAINQELFCVLTNFMYGLHSLMRTPLHIRIGASGCSPIWLSGRSGLSSSAASLSRQFTKQRRCPRGAHQLEICECWNVISTDTINYETIGLLSRNNLDLVALYNV